MVVLIINQSMFGLIIKFDDIFMMSKICTPKIFKTDIEDKMLLHIQLQHDLLKEGN